MNNIEIWSKKLGIQLNDKEALAVLQKVRLKSHDLKRNLTEDEFIKIVKGAIAYH